MALNIQQRIVEKESNKVINTTFTVVVEHPTFQKHDWKELDKEPDFKDGGVCILINDKWHQDVVVPLTQSFDIQVPNDYATDTFSESKRVALKALLTAEVEKRKAEWMASLIPVPSSTRRTVLGKVAVDALVNAVAIEGGIR